jgi:maleate isomerase
VDVEIGLARTAVSRPNGVYDLEAALASAAPQTLLQAAESLASQRPVTMVYACTSGSAALGVQRDRQTCQALAEVAGCPCTSTSAAIVEACQALDAGRLGLVTPYLPVITDVLVAYYEESGLDVSAVRSLGGSGSETFAGTPIADVVEACEALATSPVEALVIACTALPTADVVAPLESKLGIPVVTANQASLWSAIRSAGLDPRVSGAGRLMEVSP